MSEGKIRSIPAAFILRRVHSLTGLWLSVFICEHLLINSQAAFWIGEDGKRFIALVNRLQDFPALHVIEVVLIGIPILFHVIWGVRRALTAETNSWPTDGSKPYLPYARNHIYTWQRLSAWILIAGIIAHVVQMRFIDYPKKAFQNHRELALVKISKDPWLDSLAGRLHVSLYSAGQIEALKIGMHSQSADVLSADPVKETKQRIDRLASFRLKENQLVAAASDRGTAIFLMVRDTFKNPWIAILYSLFVITAVFHACNGFWTFLLTWGIVVSIPVQKVFLRLSWVAMAVLSFLGLSAIWMTYWINPGY